MKKLALLIILSSVGCITEVGGEYTVDYGDARRATVEAWEEVIGRVSDGCYQRSIDAMVTESDRFPESCIPPETFGKYVGCYLATDDLGIGGDMIYILSNRTDKQKKDTAVHEFTHLLSNCEFGDGGFIDVGLIFDCAVYYIAELDFPDRCTDLPGDYFHLDNRLWDKFGTNTVEAVGCAGLEVSP